MNQRWWQWQRGGTLFLWSTWIWEKAMFSLQSRIQTVWFHLKFKTLLLVLEVRTAARWRMGVSVLLGLSEWLGLAFARCLRLVRILMEHILCINLRTTWNMSPFDCKWQNLSWNWPMFCRTFIRMPRSMVLASWTVDLEHQHRQHLGIPCMLPAGEQVLMKSCFIYVLWHLCCRLVVFADELVHVDSTLHWNRSSFTPPSRFSWELCCFNSNFLTTLN